MHSALQHRADKTCIAKISQPKHIFLAGERDRTARAAAHAQKRAREPRGAGEGRA